MRVTCKNIACKDYYRLRQGEHCQAEEICKSYMSNKKKAEKKITRCKDCEFCKRIYTNEMKEYHHECTYNGRRRVILFANDRICDVRNN